MMNVEKFNLTNISKPKYELKYIHFTQEEMVYITEHNGCYTKSRYKKIKEFISKNKDLKNFEEQIKDVGKLNSMEHSPFSYVLNLVLYGRINVSFKVMRKIIALSYNEACYEGSDFMNITFIDSFKNKCIDLGYSKDVIARNTFEIMSILLFFKGTIEQIPYMFNKYVELGNKNVEKLSLRIPPLYTVLTNMGYELGNSKLYLKEYPKCQFVAYNMKQEFMEGLNKYLEWYANKEDPKTIKVIRSHLTIFFNYISEKFPSITNLHCITNHHLSEFNKYQLNTKNIRGKINSPGTINHRAEAISSFWEYFIKENEYEISVNIVTKYDKLIEPKKYVKNIKKEDYNKLIKALNNTKCAEFVQMKIIIIILLSTGRRIHEVLSLKYDCLNPIKGKDFIYFHKFKHDKPPRNISINNMCKFLVLTAKEIANNYSIPLKSKYDNLVVRRLFPSISRKGMSVLSDTGVRNLFYKFQVENGIVNEKGEPIFKIHDIKRTFVSNMLGLGYSSDVISGFLNQKIDSLVPYESNNEMAMKTLKLAEEKGLLIGGEFLKESILELQDNKLKSKIVNLLKNTDVVNRYKENLMYKIKNPEEVMPLALGECTDIGSISECGTLVCLTCEEILPDDINIIEEYFLKVFKYIYKNKRKQKIQEVEKQVITAYRNIYINKEKMSEIEMKKHINSIKKKAREIILVE